MSFNIGTYVAAIMISIMVKKKHWSDMAQRIKWHVNQSIKTALKPSALFSYSQRKPKLLPMAIESPINECDSQAWTYNIQTTVGYWDKSSAVGFSSTLVHSVVMVVATAEGPGMSGVTGSIPSRGDPQFITILTDLKLPCVISVNSVNAVSFGATNGTENDTRQL